MTGYPSRPLRVLALCVLLSGCAGPAQTPPPLSGTPTTIPSMPTQQASPSAQTPPSSAPPASAAVSPTAAPSQPATTAPFAWHELDVAQGPSPRQDHTWTVAADGNMAYLFGGATADGPSDELWQFDLMAGAWTQLEPANDGPAARFGHTATWVPDIGLVVWSGQGASGFFDDIWRFQPSANSWEQLPSTGAVPPARYGSCASLGPDGQLWISHGFTQDTGRFADTRSYEFGTGIWSDRTPADRVPVERCLHDCFWSATGGLILYGGQTTGVPALGDIWAYEIATGTWHEGQSPPAPPRHLYGIAQVGFRWLVFGGGSLDRGYLDDTWLIDDERNLTEARPGGSPPPARSGASLISDTAGARVLMFGGVNGEGHLGDHWELPFGNI